MSDVMNRKELLAEIRRLNRILLAQMRVVHRLVDKQTAATLHAQKLLRRLEGRTK